MEVRLTHPTERVDWMLDSPHPPRAVSTNVVPPIRALHARAGMAPGAGPGCATGRVLGVFLFDVECFE